MRSKKGFAVGDMLPLGMTIVVLGIALALGLTVLADFKSDTVTATAQGNSHCGLNTTNGTGGTLVYTGCGYDYNGTQDAEIGLNKFTSYLPTIGLVIVVAVIIGIIVRYLFVR